MAAGFGFLLTGGGHLAEDDAQDQRLRQRLAEAGETHFHLVENQGATAVRQAPAWPPFAARLAVASPFAQLQEVVAGVDPPFGCVSNHFYVFGQHPTRGMYLGQHPTLLLSGCVPAPRGQFAPVCGFAGNGYAALPCLAPVLPVLRAIRSAIAGENFNVGKPLLRNCIPRPRRQIPLPPQGFQKTLN